MILFEFSSKNPTAVLATQLGKGVTPSRSRSLPLFFFPNSSLVLDMDSQKAVALLLFNYLQNAWDEMALELAERIEEESAEDDEEFEEALARVLVTNPENPLYHSVSNLLLHILQQFAAETPRRNMSQVTVLAIALFQYLQMAYEEAAMQIEYEQEVEEEEEERRRIEELFVAECLIADSYRSRLLSLVPLVLGNFSVFQISRLYSRRRYGVRDIYALLHEFPNLCLSCTRFTVEELDTVVRDLYPLVRLPRDIYGKFPPAHLRRIRACILSTENRITMTLIWLGHYATLERVGVEFGIAGDLVFLDSYHILPCIIIRYGHLIRWPSEEEREALHGMIPDFPMAIGYVDTTPHFIHMPGVGQNQFWYSHGRVRGHAMVAQITVNYHGIPIHASFGHLGSSNDHATLHRSGLQAMPFSPGEYVIGDAEYQGEARVLCPYANPQTAEQEFFNSVIREYRWINETFMGVRKRFMICRARFRHHLRFLPIVDWATTLLATFILIERGPSV